mmetsp:Transcript_11609/g.16687  ORF Transcript_11609/g.16687 Transcript_11609/m.16687 type:complete len:835 (-) Transcript_11609:69-2573(-)
MAFGSIKNAAQSTGSNSASELVDDLKERNAALELQIKCAKDEIASRDSKIQALDRRARRLEERVEQAEAETRCSDELVDELQDSKNFLADEVKQVKLELEDRIRKIETLEADKHKSALVKELESCKADLTVKLLEVEHRNNEFQNEVEYLMADVRDLEDQLQASGYNSNEVIRELENANADLCEKNQQLESNCKRLESELSYLQSDQSEIRTLEAENNRLNTQLDDAKNRCQQLEKNRLVAQEFQIALHVEKDKNTIIMGELTTMKENWVTLEKSHTAVILSKDDRLRAIETENEELRMNIQQIREELQRRIDEVHSLEQRCVSLSQASENDDAKDELLQHLQTSNKNLSTKISECENDLREREAEIKILQNKIMELEEIINCSRGQDAKIAKLSNALESVELKSKEFQTTNSFLELKCMGLEMKVVECGNLKKGIAELQELLDGSKWQAKEDSAKLMEKNGSLLNELSLSRQLLAEKDTEMRRLEKTSRSLQQQTAKNDLNYKEIMEDLMSSNAELTSLFAEKEQEKLQLQGELETLRGIIRGLEDHNKLDQEDNKKSFQVSEASLREELDNSEKSRMAQERQMKELEGQCMRLESFIRHQMGSPRSVLNKSEAASSGTASSATLTDFGEKWAKYNQSLSKLASRNDKLQIDLEDTRQRISIISKEISRRFQRRGESTSYLSKYAQLIKKMSYRNDQIQMELNEARGKVVSLQEEQSRGSDDLSTDSSGVLLDRSQLLHQLATRHKDIHLELVKSRNKVIVLQKEVRELSMDIGDNEKLCNLESERQEECKEGRRSAVSRVPIFRPSTTAVDRFVTDGSTIISDSCDGSKFSI